MVTACCVSSDSMNAGNHEGLMEGAIPEVVSMKSVEPLVAVFEENVRSFISTSQGTEER